MPFAVTYCVTVDIEIIMRKHFPNNGMRNTCCVLMPLPYNDVIMSAMASQITSLTSVYSNVYSKRRSKKTSKLRVTGLCAGNSPVTGEFPAQRASNAEKVSIWWRPHYLEKCLHMVIPNRGPFYLHGLTLIPAWISNYIHYKVWDEIAYPFLNFNGAYAPSLNYLSIGISVMIIFERQNCSNTPLIMISLLQIHHICTLCHNTKNWTQQKLKWGSFVKKIN